MTQIELVALMQGDLQREYEHMMYYLTAATVVEGLHREELREFFLKEAHEEMGHFHEFADIISYLGGKPCVSGGNCADCNDLRAGCTLVVPSPDPYDILAGIVKMEQEVADNYANRLHQTEYDGGTSTPPELGGQYTSTPAYPAYLAAVHVFYEDQIKNSQMTAWEVGKWLKKFPVKVAAES